SNGVAAAGGSQGNVGGGGGVGVASAQAGFDRLQQNMLEAYETLERNEQGYATTDGLLAIINSIRNAPGRKAIIFFSEGLAIPPDVQERFRGVISAANRANVSVYSVDAAGLRVESPLAETITQERSLSQRRSRSNASGNEDTSGRPMMVQMERNEDLLRLNPHSGLGQLSDETGGFLIANTNNLAPGLLRVDEDMRFHYEINYAPKNPEYDGRFRQIDVKVNKPGLEVFTRKGYFAVPPVGSAPVLGYEAPALAVMAKPNTKDTLPMRISALTFPESKRPGLVPVLVRVPAAALAYSVDSEKKTYSTDFTVVALIKDESGRDVKKLSQHYQLSGSSDELDAARRGDVLFYREAVLPPGTYSVEAIAYDSLTRRSCVRTASVEVAAADVAKLRLSSLVLLKRAEKLSADDQKVSNPFHYGELLVYPNMGEPLLKSANKDLSFFFTVYPAVGSTSSPKLTVEVETANGKGLARTSPPLPAADATGRIQFASQLPLGAYPPGSYSLKITVTDGLSTVSRSVPFTVLR
ncbi:MAG TPA: VWA domain-containing protein, partial [Blastocatellia bacterium]|nr:VWA domain-containing protein [Blastocatellia bacterium]